MWLATAVEWAMVATFAALGVVAYRETVALRSWDDRFLRGGWIILRRRTIVDPAPATLPMPQLLKGWSSSSLHARRLGPLEVAFTAQVMTTPLMKGILAVDAEARQVVLTGRAYWGVLPLLLVGVVYLTLDPGRAAAPWLLVYVGVFLAAVYWFERRRFLKALESVVAATREQGPSRNQATEPSG
jgi:hypothetical protein